MANKKSYLVLNGFTATNPDTSDGAPVVVVYDRGDVVTLDEPTVVVELQRNRIVEVEEATEATVAAVQADVRVAFGEAHTFRSVA